MSQGLVVPAISLQLRERLQAVITNHGLTLERQAEVGGRQVHVTGGRR